MLNETLDNPAQSQAGIMRGIITRNRTCEHQIFLFAPLLLAPRPSYVECKSVCQRRAARLYLFSFGSVTVLLFFCDKLRVTGRKKSFVLFSESSETRRETWQL